MITITQLPQTPGQFAGDHIAALEWNPAPRRQSVPPYKGVESGMAQMASSMEPKINLSKTEFLGR
jgi:hypothetical protein